MKKRIGLMICFCVVLVSFAFAGERDIIPGVQLGSVTKNSSEKSLIKVFGVANVHSSKGTPGSEDENTVLTILFSGDKQKEIEISWSDSDSKMSPRYASTRGSWWKGPFGIYVGISMKELQKINGKPFMFMPFNTDEGGNIVDWNGGKLANLGAVTIALEEGTLVQDYGRGEYLSSDPKIQKKFNPKVGMIRVQF